MVKGDETMSHKVKCEECGTEVSNASCRTIEAKKVWLCGVCDGEVEPCRQCGSHDVVYSDHGVDLCQECKDNSTPEQKAWLYEQDYADALESGHPMADHMPLPSNWR
jgi:hypothetical protein